MSTDELLAEALRLPRDQRARFAESLLSSLEEPREAVAAAWAEELDRRSIQIKEGRVETVSWEEAQSAVLDDLKQRRADPASS